MTITRKLIAMASVSPGTIIHLTYEQFDARRHALAAVKDAHKDRRDPTRRPYKSDQILVFKAGETIEVEGALDRPLQTAMGLSDEDLVDGGAAKPGVKASVLAARKGVLTKANKRLAAAEGALQEAQQKLAAAAEDKKAKVQALVTKAEAEVTDAKAAVADAAAKAGEA